ncbi:MAG: histidine phosphatase family protein [Planctomycetaceae bacterium]
MKTLLLMRHAKSSWDDPDLTDIQRPLNARGRDDAPRMGRFLRDRGLIPDHVLTSSAVRARATGESVADACQVSEKVTVTESLYQADVCAWQAVIVAFPADWNCVLCVGHNPEIEELIGTLTNRYVRMPTAAIARLTCDVPRWEEFVNSDDVSIQDVWRPKDLK